MTKDKEEEMVVSVAISPNEAYFIYEFSNGARGLWGEGRDEQPLEVLKGELPSNFTDLMATDPPMVMEMSEEEIALLQSMGYV